MHINTYTHTQRMTSQLTDAQSNEGQHTDSSTREDLRKLQSNAHRSRIGHHTGRHTQMCTKTACHTKKPGETAIDPSPWAESQDNRLRHTVVQGQAYTWSVIHKHGQTQEYTHTNTQPYTHSH